MESSHSRVRGGRGSRPQIRCRSASIRSRGQTRGQRSEPGTSDPAFVFSTYFGGAGNEIARGIARDASGAIYMCGSTSSGNLPTSRTSYQPTYRGGSAYTIGDAFLAKFTASGALSFVTYFGGSWDDIATALALDGAGNVYLTAFTASLDFPLLSCLQQNSSPSRA